MKLKRVIRLDSTPLNRAFFTEEGYLIDTPILTSTGIFEYANSDGSVRRELRLPEEVFAADSLASYEGRPIIITHDAGLVTKDNVQENGIGTILTKGYRDGDDVRAKIVIHDTNEMKASGLKELSLGYNLDLDETPGEWKGQPYDAIQRNIRINHLALVREARAGDQARLNIDSRDAIRKGVKVMSNKRISARRSDGVLSPEELQKAIEEYKANHPVTSKDGEDQKQAPQEVPIPAKAEDGDAPVAALAGKEEKPEDKAAEVRAAFEKKDGETPNGTVNPQDTIARQDEDIQKLLDIIDSLLAEREFKATKAQDGENCEEGAADCNLDDGEEEVPMEAAENQDDDDDPVPNTEEGDLAPNEVMNADSVDRIIRDRVKVGITAEKLNMDGLENMRLSDAKRAIIRAVRPTMNLDGKSASYINAAFDLACADVKARTRKDTAYQKKQMFNGDARDRFARGSSADDARTRMIERRQHKNAKEDK